MDRPKHRWFIVSALILGAGLLLLAHPWISTPEPAHAPAAVATTYPAEPLSHHSEPPVEAPALAATAMPPATTSQTVENGTFRGRVIDAVTRQPVSKFEVQLYQGPRGIARLGKQPITQQFESKTGRFTWKQAPTGQWSVTVAAKGYQAFEIAQLRIDAGEAMQELVLPLMRGYTLRGRVFDRSSGAGIGEALIEVREPRAVARRGADAQRFEKAGDDGSFVIEGVPGGDIVIAVTSRTHASRSLDVLVNDTTAPLEIELSSGGTIAGFVAGPDGNPVPGLVMLFGADAPAMKREDNGAFFIPHLAAGRYVLQANTAVGNGRLEIVLAEDENRTNVVLKVTAGRSIRGVITGLTSEQLEQTHVSLQPKGGGYFIARVDGRGAYALGGVPPGRVRLTARAAFSRALHKTLDMPADKDVVLDLVFPQGSRLTGRVTQGGKPVPDTGIWLRPVDDPSTEYMGSTKEDGRYEIDGLVAGEYSLTADEAVSRKVTIAGDATLDIEIPSVQLGGRVIEDGTAVPVVDADVFVRGMETATSRVHNDEDTDHFGNFELTGLEPGAVTLTVFKPGYGMYRERIAYSTPITNRTIRLKRGSGVELKVRTNRGEPVQGGVLLSEEVPGNDWGVDLYIPLDSEGVGSVPGTLAGSKITVIHERDRVVIPEWDGQPLDVKF
jgi:hypothetical protein